MNLILWILILVFIASMPFIIHRLLTKNSSLLNIKEYLIPLIILLTDIWLIESFDFIINLLWLKVINWPVSCNAFCDWWWIIFYFFLFLFLIFLRELVLIKQKNIKYFIFSNLWIIFIFIALLIK